MSRFARHRRVFIIEEPVFADTPEPQMSLSERESGGLIIAAPVLPRGAGLASAIEMQKFLVDELIRARNIRAFTLWYYTPMALSFSRHLKAECVIYDCMDELSAFRGAPMELLDLERELFSVADHVFTGGHSLYEHKRAQHPRVHPFPSSIDANHFGQARELAISGQDPLDQAGIPRPRLGFFGVIDERADLQLIDQVARMRPDWHLVVIGPVAKISPDSLPRRANIHYLGMKGYKELPAYLAHWDVAIMPFALNESTRFISPTKTPEYLAAGKPVVSTPIRDVVRPYAEEGLVHVAETPMDFIAAAEQAMHINDDLAWRKEWLMRVDAFLSQTSWDLTWQTMSDLEREITTGQDEDSDLGVGAAGVGGKRQEHASLFDAEFALPFGAGLGAELGSELGSEVASELN